MKTAAFILVSLSIGLEVSYGATLSRRGKGKDHGNKGCWDKDDPLQHMAYEYMVCEAVLSVSNSNCDGIEGEITGYMESIYADEEGIFDTLAQKTNEILLQLYDAFNDFMIDSESEKFTRDNKEQHNATIELVRLFYNELFNDDQKAITVLACQYNKCGADLWVEAIEERGVPSTCENVETQSIESMEELDEAVEDGDTLATADNMKQLTCFAAKALMNEDFVKLLKDEKVEKCFEEDFEEDMNDIQKKALFRKITVKKSESDLKKKLVAQLKRLLMEYETPKITGRQNFRRALRKLGL